MPKVCDPTPYVTCTTSDVEQVIKVVTKINRDAGMAAHNHVESIKCEMSSPRDAKLATRGLANHDLAARGIPAQNPGHGYTQHQAALAASAAVRAFCYVMQATCQPDPYHRESYARLGQYEIKHAKRLLVEHP